MAASSPHRALATAHPSPAQDPLYKHAISQITEVDPLTSPSKYQSDSTLLLRRLYTLWVDHHRLEFVADVEYLLKLTNMYLDRVDKQIPHQHRQPGGERWIIGRCIALRARMLAVVGNGDEARAELWQTVSSSAAATARRVADLSGIWDDKGKLRAGGDAVEEMKWTPTADEILEDTLVVLQDLLPLPTQQLYNPRTVVLFVPRPGGHDEDELARDDDPFNNAAHTNGDSPSRPRASPGPQTHQSSTTVPLSSIGRHRALVASLISFAASLLYPSAASTHLPRLHQLTSAAVVATKQLVLRAMLETWPTPPSSSSSTGHPTGSPGSVFETEYLRIAREVGVTEQGVWPAVMEAVRRRATNVKEDGDREGDEMEIDDADEAADEDKKRRQRRATEVDAALRDIFGGAEELWALEREREEIVNSGTASALVALLSVLPEGDGSDLQVVAVRILSLLPSSLPLLSPIAHLLAAQSGPSVPVAPPPSSQPTSLKRKRGTHLENWIEFAYSMMAFCFRMDTSEEIVQPAGRTEKEKRQDLVHGLSRILTGVRNCDNDFSPADVVHIARHIPLVVLSIVIAARSNPPPCHFSAESVSYADLRALARGVQSLPVAVPNALLRTGASEGRMHTKIRVALFDASSLAVSHIYTKPESKTSPLDTGKDLVKFVGNAFVHAERNVRLAAGRFFLAYVKFQLSLDLDEPAVLRVRPLYVALTNVFGNGHNLQAKETALSTLGLLGQTVEDEGLLQKISSQLVSQLAEPDPWLKAQAHCAIVSFAQHQGRAPYKVFYPFRKEISTRLVDAMASAPSMLADFVALTNETEENFLDTTRMYTIPHLVVTQNKAILVSIARILDQKVAGLLMDQLVPSLIAVLLASDEQTEKGFNFLLSIVTGVDKHGRKEKLTPSKLMKSAEPVKILYSLVVELGDTDPAVVSTALHALSKAELRSRESESSSTGDLGDFLKPYMLGIISSVNELLQSKKSVHEKSKVIRSLGVLMKKIGLMMATYSQQILVTLQGNLNKQPLRLVTLETWNIFVTTLRFRDIAPHIGPTTAAFVTSWATFSPEERALAAQTVNYAIIDSGDQALENVFDDIVALDGIDELRQAGRKLRERRRNWTLVEQIRNLIRRAEDENTTISVRSLQELKTVLLQPDKLASFATGNTFSPVVGELVQMLLHSAARDGDQVDDLRDISLECLGIIGALDPDRFQMSSEQDKPIADDTFATREAAQGFATRLIVELLVGAFRATNDTRYQENLAYAIQELAKFSGFTKALLDRDRHDKDVEPNPVGVRIRKRWKEIPPEKSVTIADMLDTRYTLRETEAHKQPTSYPIYPSSRTYRSWIQTWTRDLIFKTQGEFARRIFVVFQVIIQSSDVHIARHLLPHLVLHILLSGSDTHRRQITDEIRTVLADQVQPQGDHAPERRLLSAQTVFDLMDHLSKWTRDRRVESIKRKAELKQANKSTSTTSKAQIESLQLKSEALVELLKKVDGVIGSIDCKLTAQAALQCKAFPRSLLNFEQRILDLQKDELGNAVELQQHYENLHKIYAQLDEPDGMEGISTKVLAPSLEHQIREHESTGRWTSAQSCWEVQIQESPNDPALHLGLLRCLRNLGHYDTLRTHIRGLLSRSPEWETMLSSFQVEGAWMVGDWEAVGQILERNEVATPELAIARVLVSLQSADDALPAALRAARLELGRPLTAAGRDSYQRFYDSVVQLHLLHELETIARSGRVEIVGLNRDVLGRQEVSKMKVMLGDRLERTMPSFRVQEPILSMRRTALNLCNNPLVDSHAEIGQAWLLSSKIARKAGHVQTAYSAVLQAGQSSTPFAFVQGAKLLASGGQALRALQELQHSLDPLLEAGLRDKADQAGSTSGGPSTLAKAALLKARWVRDAERFSDNDVIGGFTQVIALEKDWESAYYHLGHFYDRDAPERPDNTFSLQCFENTVKNYSLALRYGTKYIYRTMPRMLTIWLDMGARERMATLTKDSNPGSEGARIFKSTDRNITETISQLPVYEWLTTFPQVVSRIGHRSPLVQANLEKIIVVVLRMYPLQSVWSMVSVAQSKKDERKKRCLRMLDTASQGHTRSTGGGHTSQVADLYEFFQNARRMAKYLVELAEKQVKTSTFSIEDKLPKLLAVLPSPLLLPTQEALTVALPFAFTGNSKEHNPFPVKVVTFSKFKDEVDVMSSLIRPKKLSVYGSDGATYSFLVKPSDDLRKDARLMDFNGMINKLLKNDSDSRRRNLYIRTYAVVPLSEECGLCEWVNNTVPFRTIIHKYYHPRGLHIHGQNVGEDFAKFQAPGNSDADIIAGYEKVVAKFPQVFHEWFLEMFPEPTSWLAARRAYARTYAVMCMVGFVLGLGDRHCENTLYDSNSGDTVHVDLNCLFEKGRTFDVKERVPFRLTPNQIDGFGITGVEGVYRKACEVTMRILRENKDSLMSVLEAFVHDPLVEWEADKAKIDRTQKAKQKSNALKSKPRLDPDEVEAPPTIESLASKALAPIERKLRGVQAAFVAPGEPIPTKEISVGNQVEAVIQEATSKLNLGRHYIGWGSHI